MKTITGLWCVHLILLCFIFASCKKEKTDEEKLPAITQTGANTFGCLINGKLYQPKGTIGPFKPNLDIMVDPTFSEGSFSVSTFNSDNTTLDLSFGSDSIKATGVYEISPYSRAGFLFSKSISGNVQCQTLSKIDHVGTGYIKVTRYDLINRIFSGEFEFHFTNTACGIGNPIDITQGRFDIKL